jgi:hypothetical protein
LKLIEHRLHTPASLRPGGEKLHKCPKNENLPNDFKSSNFDVALTKSPGWMEVVTHNAQVQFRQTPRLLYVLLNEQPSWTGGIAIQALAGAKFGRV